MEKIILIMMAGMALGSFLNVVIFRIPRRISLIRPPSSCPACKKRIPFYDNIPLFSFLLLRGRCRHCGNKIPLSYPLVEILTPLSFLILHHHYGFSLHFFTACFFTSSLIILCFIDFYHQLLPDKVTLPVLVLALVYSGFRADMNLKQSLIGATAGSGFLLFIYGAYYLLRKKEGLGMGDVTMMLMIGAYLGLTRTFLTLILASFAGAVAGILLMILKKKDWQYALPLGTFLAPAAFVSLVWGERIISAYLALFKNTAP